MKSVLKFNGFKRGNGTTAVTSQECTCSSIHLSLGLVTVNINYKEHFNFRHIFHLVTIICCSLSLHHKYYSYKSLNIINIIICSTALFLALANFTVP
jgi:hypothetical protein